MTIVSAQTDLPRQTLGGVPLARYANLVTIDENAFWGIEREYPFKEEYSVWTLRERRMIAHYLDEAQRRIEERIGYALNPRWFEDEMIYSCPLTAKRGYVIEPGIEAWDLIESGATVDKASDPHEVSVTTTVTDEDEIFVAYPSTLVEDRLEINPSNIDISGGTATIYIPRCRMIKPSEADNPSTGLDYDDDTLFVDTVDVWRRYNDESTNATLVWPHCASSTVLPFCSTTCEEYTRNGCIYVRNEQLGILDVLPATYSAASGWSACQSCYSSPERAHLYYRAGLSPITPDAETAVVRYANSLMPRMPCGCEKFVLSWEEDNFIPKTMTRERVNNPLGLKDGAWHAWSYIVDNRIVRAGVVGG